jgi:CBS domain-containing protein
VRIFEVMTKEVETVAPTLIAAEAAERMRQNRIRHLVVKDGRTIVGVLSDRDVRGRGAAQLTQQTVADLMTRSAVSIGPRDTVRAAANLMRGRTIGCLPVVERERLIGIVTVTDLLDLLGRGVDRSTQPERVSLHYRVPHRKQRRFSAAW